MFPRLDSLVALESLLCIFYMSGDMKTWTFAFWRRDKQDFLCCLSVEQTNTPTVNYPCDLRHLGSLNVLGKSLSAARWVIKN